MPESRQDVIAWIRGQHKGGLLPKGMRKLLGVMGKFITLVMVIVSWVYTFFKTSDSSHQFIACQLFFTLNR